MGTDVVSINIDGWLPRIIRLDDFKPGTAESKRQTTGTSKQFNNPHFNPPQT